MYNRNIINELKDHPKLFHKFTRYKLSVKDQIIRLQSFKRKVIFIHEEMCEELNIVSKSVYPLPQRFENAIATGQGERDTLRK